jgi:hypothetical protein
MPQTISERIVLESLTGYGFLKLSKVWLRYLGALEAVVLSNYLEKYIYFKQNYPYMKGWFYLQHKVIATELGMKEYTVQTIKASFIKQGFLLSEMKGLPAKEMLTINFKALAKLLEEMSEKTRTQAPEKTNRQDPEKTGGLYPEKTGGHIIRYKYNKNKENNNKEKDINIFIPTPAESGTDSDRQSPKNDNSILDERQKEKLKQIKRFSRLAESLYDHIQETKQIKLPNTRINQWAKDLELLSRIDGVDYPRQKKALDWYYNHYSEQYVPVIESGASFRSKFIKLEAAMQRANQPKKNNNYTLGHLPKDPKDRIKYRDDGVLNSKGEFIPNTEPD